MVTPKLINSMGTVQYIVKTGGTIGIDCTHTTIASAITDSLTSGNPKYIFVKNGTYSELLSLTSSSSGITLEGESNSATILNRTSGGDGNLIYVYTGTSDITIKNFKFNLGGTPTIKTIQFNNNIVISTGSGTYNPAVCFYIVKPSSTTPYMYDITMNNNLVYASGATNDYGLTTYNNNATCDGVTTVGNLVRADNTHQIEFFNCTNTVDSGNNKLT